MTAHPAHPLRSPQIWLALLILPWLLAACQTPHEPASTTQSGALLDLGSPLVFEQDLLVVPGPRWSRWTAEDVAPGQEETGGTSWSFRSFGRLLCQVRQTPSEPLRLRLNPDRQTADFLFDATWDGQPLEPGSIRQLDEGAKGGGLELTLDPDQLAPGLHQLVIRRRHPPGTRMSEVRHDNVFEHLAYRLGEDETTLSPELRDDTFLLAEWLLHGVLGREQERRSGLVFVGPGEHRIELPMESGDSGPSGGRLVVEPENLSTIKARYRVSDGQGESVATLAPGESTRLELEVAGGSTTLGFSIESGDDAGPTPSRPLAGGLHLWSKPLYRPRVAPPGERPPIVLVTLDTTRRDALGPYRDRTRHGTVDPSPVISRWATGATVFEQAHSTAPWTLPSHASIFTGLYPSRHRAGTRDVQLPTGLPTLAALLRRHGYATLGVSAGELSSSRFGLAQGFHSFRNPDQFETPGDRVDAYAAELLEEHADVPFFLWLNYFDPHALYQAPAEYQRRFGVEEKARALEGLEGWEDLAQGGMSAWRDAVEGEIEVTPAVADYLQAAYLAEIAWTDHLVGRLFERLEQLDLFDRALIIITADHGELLGEGGYVSHGARLDPELVEIPLIVRWPGQTEGERDPRLVSLVDLFPTVLAAAGLEAPPSDGHPLGRGDRQPLRRFALLEEHEFLVHPLPRFMKVANSLYGIQRPAFRQLVWQGGEECARLSEGRWQSEPCETPHATVLSSLEELLGSTTPSDMAGSADGALSPEEQERLEALGYM